MRCLGPHYYLTDGKVLKSLTQRLQLAKMTSSGDRWVLSFPTLEKLL